MQRSATLMIPFSGLSLQPRRDGRRRRARRRRDRASDSHLTTATRRPHRVVLPSRLFKVELSLGDPVPALVVVASQHPPRTQHATSGGISQWPPEP
jgi:hypothetical protein